MILEGRAGNQRSFPKGRLRGGETPWGTALRETWGGDRGLARPFVDGRLVRPAVLLHAGHPVRGRPRARAAPLQQDRPA
eukprot:12736790-Alexandrium_andersonii.AAC.1